MVARFENLRWGCDGGGDPPPKRRDHLPRTPSALTRGLKARSRLLIQAIQNLERLRPTTSRRRALTEAIRGLRRDLKEVDRRIAELERKRGPRPFLVK